MTLELLRSDKKYTRGVDVHVFSMIAYEIVGCKVPFEDKSEIISPITIRMKFLSDHRLKFPEYVSKKKYKTSSQDVGMTTMKIGHHLMKYIKNYQKIIHNLMII